MWWGRSEMSFFSGGKTYILKSFEDPAAVNGNNPGKFDAFRRDRDEIKFWLEKTIKVTMRAVNNIMVNKGYKNPLD
jgi:hypothetical protein